MAMTMLRCHGLLHRPLHSWLHSLLHTLFHTLFLTETMLDTKTNHDAGRAETDSVIANDERAPNEQPVRVVAPAAIHLPSGARAPVYVSDAWHRPEQSAHITTALIVIHGRLRNADVYYDSAERAVLAAGRSLDDTLLVVPQFLAEADIDAHGLSADTLAWDWTGWMGGDVAMRPAPISSFAVIDAIIDQLADATRFPALTQLVVVGHSGGGQVVHRYAVVAQGTPGMPGMQARDMHTRYVIANPSSYVYFDEDRPQADGHFAPFDRQQCAHFDHWKYGPRHAPAYIGARAFDDLERAYVARDVRYLWGERDCSPTHPALDISCAAQAQGPDRLSRGLAYFRYLQQRHGVSLAHQGAIVPGVGHDGDGMLTSSEGVAALFGQ